MIFDGSEIRHVSNCPVCNRGAVVFCDLPGYPITEVFKNFGNGDYQGPTKADQSLRYCGPCKHLFLGTHLPKDFIYTNYVTESSGSQGSMLALRNFYDFVMEHLTFTPDSVIDIGANDTSLLELFLHFKCKLLGIDPNVSSPIPEIECFKGYVEDFEFGEISMGKRVFLCSHTLEHIYQPKAFFERLSSALTSDDEVFMQFPSLELLVRDARFDQVHHQHLNYFSLSSISKLVSDFGLSVVSYRYDSDHYGALMCRIRKCSAVCLSTKPGLDLSDLNAAHGVFIQSINAAECRIAAFKDDFYCFGASLMLPILAFYMPSLHRACSILDGSPAKLGLTYVNFERPISSDAGFHFNEADFVVTAVATKAAARSVTNLLSQRDARNIVLPLNML